MNNNKMYEKKTFVLLIVLVCLMFVQFNAITSNFINGNSGRDIIGESAEQLVEKENETPKLAEYAEIVNGTGNNFNVTLHQSYVKEGNPLYNISNFNSLTNRTVQADCPKDSMFNSSYTEIKIEDIYAPNKTLDLEKDISNSPRGISGDVYAFSFDALSNCTFKEFSICLTNIGTQPGQLSFSLYNSTWTGSKYDPKDDMGLFTYAENVPVETKVWHKISVDVQLNINKTRGNKFFIVFSRIFKSGFTPQFNEKQDTDDPIDSLSRLYSDPNWIDQDYEICSNVTLILSDNTPKPTDIQLKINGTLITNSGSDNAGTWTSIAHKWSSTAKLNFTISAGWWDVKLNVTKILVNYTKTNVKAYSEFSVPKESNVIWNATVNQALDDFESKFKNFYINFTIPASWQNEKTFNGTKEKTIKVIKGLNNGYSNVQVFDAGNGTNWWLNATSINFIDSIRTEVSSIDRNQMYYSEDVVIRAELSQSVKDGFFNLSVCNYNPPHYDNYTKNTDSFTAGSVVNIGTWNINYDTDLIYGPFRVQARWNNGTEAGFAEKTLTVIGNTDDLQTTIPKAEFDNGESFNITVEFDDIGQGLPIDGAQINYSIQGKPLRWNNTKPLGDGDYNITIHCNDPQFGGYGQKTIVIYANKTYYTNRTYTINIFIGARTYLDVIYDGGKTNFNSDEIFNITVQYNDTEEDEGIPEAMINYTLNEGMNWRYDNVHYFGEGRYNITVHCNDDDFGEYGTFSIVINASKETYLNKSTNLIPIIINITGVNQFTIQSPSADSMFLSSETFNITARFVDTSRSEGINDASDIKVNVDGTPYAPLEVHNYGEGYYNFTIDCSKDIFSLYGVFSIEIVINKTNYANDTDTIDVFIAGNTTLTVLSPPENTEIITGTIFNITLKLEDVVRPAQMINNADINYTLDGTTLRYDNVKDIGDGKYNITINSNDGDFKNYGSITIIINASKYAYKNQSIYFIILRQSPSKIAPSNTRNLGNIFRGNNASYMFNYSDSLDKPLPKATINNYTSLQGFTWAWIDKGNGNYSISVNSTKVQARAQEYILQFKINITGNQSQIITISIIVLLPLTSINNLISNLVGQVVLEGFNLIINFTFWDTYKNLPISTIDYRNITVWDLENNLNWTRGFGYIIINYYNGNYTLNISTSGLTKGNLYRILINITYTSPNPGPYNYTTEIISFYYASKSAPTLPIATGGDGGGGGGGGTTVTGFTWGDIFLWIIIAACVGGAVAAIVGIKKGVIAPKKRARERVLREVTTIFDDAVNLEHLLVIYKDMGTCVFFKSYGLEEIDPQLISGFLTAVSSFGKEMDSQEALNEIQYGDKMLLLADGQYIRVALVLDKQASTILRQHLKEFIETFEKIHSNELPKWKGKIDVFRNTGDLVDNMFHTSIILPHEIKYDLSKVKSLKIPSSREVLKVAQGLVEGSERKFFFVASLLMEAVDKTGREKAEIFMGIKELTESGVLLPIRIAAIEEKEVSKQELNLIRQRVCELPGLSEEEIKNLTNDLSKLNPVEREAYLTSCKEKAKIVSAPVKSKSGAKVIDNVKSAKKEINNLKKSAVQKIKKGDVTKAIEIYRSASVIATNWDLTKEFEELEDTVRVAQIEGLKELKIILESEARTAEKGKDYKTAVDKYNLASKAASEIFKLGITEMTKEVKRLTKKAKELGKSV